MAILVGAGLSGCGGESKQEAKPTITDPTELVDGAAIEYKAKESFEPQRLKAIQGQFLFVAVVSDTTGQLDLEGDESVKQAVKPGKLATVVVNAVETGEFDLTLRHDGEKTVLATVEVAE
ncbi:hypothetical protein BJ993_002074 [Nocardioides aromaticivorans]|uniref:Uncharacterized protein n=1 Tax=Nocardioides aromaticivorans TaxID=200618 RepID=A0A7Y9ZGF2_9ACTN|nr:hypothetical protein [Nocardioides aromaticivorans]NYI44994.1 hypothetical protein [Nocardioides aromaticivorans]